MFLCTVRLSASFISYPLQVDSEKLILIARVAQFMGLNWLFLICVPVDLGLKS